MTLNKVNRVSSRSGGNQNDGVDENKDDEEKFETKPKNSVYF